MKHKDIILLLVSALLLVIAWVAFNIYHNSVTSTTPEALEKEALIISPDFDEKTIDKLKERKRVVPVYDLEKKIDVSPVEEGFIPTASPIASEGAKIIP
jgi:hypothetical protein